MGKTFRQRSLSWKWRILAIFKKFIQAVIYTAIIVIIFLIIGQIGKSFAIEGPTSDRDQNILQNFIEWYAAIYTLALSFLVSNAWIRYNKINFQISKEAQELSLLIQIAKMSVKKRLEKNLTRAILIYINYIRHTTHNDSRTAIEAENKIMVINDCVAQIVADKKTAENTKSMLMAHYFQFYNARSDRFDLIEQKFSLRFWLLLAAFSVFWIHGFLWLKPDVESLEIYMIFVMVFAITILLGNGIDLENPATGFWRMDFTPFQKNNF